MKMREICRRVVAAELCERRNPAVKDDEKILKISTLNLHHWEGHYYLVMHRRILAYVHRSTGQIIRD